MADKVQAELKLTPKDYKYGFHDDVDSVFKSGKGLTKRLVEAMSKMKSEPEWMLKFRLKALEAFERKAMPTWATTQCSTIWIFRTSITTCVPARRPKKVGTRFRKA